MLETSYSLRCENGHASDHHRRHENRTTVAAAAPGVTASDHDASTAIVRWSYTWSRRFDKRVITGKLEIPCGQSLLFTVDNRRGLREAETTEAVGRIDVASNHWSMSNFTATTTFVIENLEGGAELVKVVPRRLAVVIPFEMSKVSIPSHNTMAELTVFGTPPTFLRHALSGEADALAARLNEESKYFLILVALCEPRLRFSSMAAVPSVREVVDRLKPLPDFANANRSSINYHIDYLHESKLTLDDWALSAHGGRKHSKREALVSYALRYDLVREEHLSLLPAWPHQRSA